MAVASAASERNGVILMAKGYAVVSFTNLLGKRDFREGRRPRGGKSGRVVGGFPRAGSTRYQRTKEVESVRVRERCSDEFGAGGGWR